MFADLKNHQLSLSLIGCLLVLRFIIVPIIDWQDESLAEVNLLKNQHERIKYVLKKRNQITDFDASLESSLKTATPLFWQSNDPAAFQLERQRWLEDKIKKFELDVKSIGWNPNVMFSKIKTAGHPLQISIEGQTIDAIKLVQFLQSQTEFIEVESFSFQLNRVRDSVLGKTRLRLNLVFYRQGEF